MQYGESDSTASSPKEKPVHPTDLLATVTRARIDPDCNTQSPQSASRIGEGTARRGSVGVLR